MVSELELELGYIEHSTRETVYSALQSALAWVVYGFLLDGELLIGSYSITFLLVQIFEYPVSLSLINMTRDFRVLFLEKVESA